MAMSKGQHALAKRNVIDSRDRFGAGIAFALTGMFGVSVMDALAKLLGEGYAVSQIILARNAIGVVAVLAFVILARRGFGGLRIQKIPLLLLRIVFGLAAAFFFFTGLRYLPLADAFAIAFTAPLLITALSVPLLGEKVGFRRWAAVVIGFIGVVIVVQPGTSSFQIEALLPLGAAFSYALTMIVSRRMTQDMTTSAIVFWSSLGAALLMSTLMPSQWRTPGLDDALLFLFMGLIGTLGMALITQAYRFAEASVIAPFDYSTLLWATLLGWLIWEDLPSPNVWLGASLLIASGLYILHRETRQRQPNGNPAP